MSFLIRTTNNFAGLEQGWSESFYWLQNTDDLNAAETAVTPLAQKRAKLLSKGYSLTVVRNAIVLDNAGAVVKRVTDLFEPRLPGVQAWADAEPNIALMCTWQDPTNKFQKRQYMRGIPAGIVDNGKQPDLGFGAFSTNYNNWRESMRVFGAGWLVSAVSETATITSYASASNGIVTFTIDEGITWPQAVGQPTRVYVKLPGKSPLDGALIVVRNPDNLHPFTKNPIGVAPFVTGQVGTMERRSTSLVTLLGTGGQGATGIIHPQRIVTHKTGRPFYASRGRVPVKAKW